MKSYYCKFIALIFVLTGCSDTNGREYSISEEFTSVDDCWTPNWLNGTRVRGRFSMTDGFGVEGPIIKVAPICKSDVELRVEPAADDDSNFEELYIWIRDSKSGSIISYCEFKFIEAGEFSVFELISCQAPL